MDERTASLMKDEPASRNEEDPADKGERLEKDIESIRDNLTHLVGELDNRRHDAFNIPLQIKRHAVPLAIGGLALVSLVGGGIALHRLTQPRHPRLSKRWKDVKDGLHLAAGQGPPPEAAKPSVAKRVMGAAGAALASVLVRHLAHRFLNGSKASLRSVEKPRPQLAPARPV